MALSDAERIVEFEHSFAKAQATHIVKLPWGFALLQADFPYSHYHNRIVVTSATSAVEILATAEEILGEAGLTHRFVSVDDDGLGQALRAGLIDAGYEHETIVAMVYSGPDPKPPTHEVRAVSFDTLRPAIVRDWRIELPDATEEQIGQLAGRTDLYSRGADVTLMAVFEGEEVAARADLYVDPIGRIAQFENLVTHPDYRGHGYGNSLIREALKRALQSGCELTFLTADLDDWTHEWYLRHGFVEAGRSHHFDTAESRLVD